MSHKLTIKAFFFNAKTDYLPYYKNFSLTMESDATAKEVLAQIHEKNENFSYPKQLLVFRINGLVVDAKETVGTIVERLGTELQIDPVSSYRSNDGLKINDADFMQSFELLASYASEDDLKTYKKMYALHYASESSNFDRTYIGDAVLVLAHKMIQNNPENEEAILEAITSVQSGLMDCEYENNLFNAEDHTETIEALKKLANPEDGPSLCSLIMTRIRGKEKVEKEVVEPKRKIVTINNLEEKTVAHYAGLSSHTKMHALMHDKDIREVHFSRVNKLSGLHILEANKDLAFKKAGATLLDAFDAGTEVLVVEDLDTFDMFTQNFAAIERTIGRKMIGLELISSEDFETQISSIEA
ncbi:hypothetical protein [Sulfurovum sp.]|uniref:hypothetical protein n=1 Tax=Sulfurovum sp. TaxID=1969726 RepID=UPI002867B296|nr:hypothetical protein [Sulfurovum sp.]